MQTVLVAGGAGFIGSNLCEALLSEEYKVICVDNLISGDKRNVDAFSKNAQFTNLTLDITKDISVLKKLSAIDYLFHLASPASPNEKSKRSYMNHPIETLLANSYGTYQLLELAREKSSRFLFASTSEIYGDPKISPQPEEYFGNVNPNGVRSVYDEAKRFGEAITMAYARTYQLNARIVRIFNTYGPRMQQDDGRVVSNFIVQAIHNKPLTIYGDGTQTRSFCYIEDMVKSLQAAMFYNDIQGEVINLGSEHERKIIDLANLIKELCRSTSEIVFEPLPLDDPKTRRPDISKARKLLGWEPKVSLEEGLKKTIEYFKQT